MSCTSDFIALPLTKTIVGVWWLGELTRKVCFFFYGFESLSYFGHFGHCAHSSFYYLCNLVFLYLCFVMYSSVEILSVNSAININL